MAGLVLCLFLALFLVAYPLYVIRPFRYQGARELAFALSILRFRLIPHILLAVLAGALLVWLWRTHLRWLPRIFALLCTFLVVGCAVLSRVNVYELMFHPLTRINFSPASKAKLDGDEEVIAIQVGSAARAYPIRSMSYHHIVNDVLAGEPIVATY
ncbi:MAG: DUF3179 domain-containing protein [Acidobacteriaceae bacterium]|nr:DUF3179 domain-containing protein [Acidobacteriaceae bacterium]